MQQWWQSTLCKTTENLLETPPKKPTKKIPPKNPNSKIQHDNPTRNPNSVNRQTRFLEGFLLYNNAGQTVLRGANAFKAI